MKENTHHSKIVWLAYVHSVSQLGMLVDSCLIHHLNKSDLQKGNGKQHSKMGVVISVVTTHNFGAYTSNFVEQKLNHHKIVTIFIKNNKQNLNIKIEKTPILRYL